MNTTFLARLSGISGITALVFLVIWTYSLMAQPQEWVLIGRIGDILLILEFLLLLPVIIQLHRRLQPRFSLGHSLLLFAGILGVVLLPVVQILHLLRLIGLAREAPFAFGAIVSIGIWVAVITFLEQTTLKSLYWPGIVSGLSVVLLVGGLAILLPSVRTLSGHSLRTHLGPLLLALLGFVGWGLGVPIWSLMVSRQRF